MCIRDIEKTILFFIFKSVHLFIFLMPDQYKLALLILCCRFWPLKIKINEITSLARRGRSCKNICSTSLKEFGVAFRSVKKKVLKFQKLIFSMIMLFHFYKILFLEKMHISMYIILDFTYKILLIIVMIKMQSIIHKTYYYSFPPRHQWMHEMQVVLNHIRVYKFSIHTYDKV